PCAPFGGTPGTDAGRLRSCAACAGTRPARPGGTSGKTGPLHPCGKVLQGTLSDPALPLLLVADAGGKRREQPVVGVHRLALTKVFRWTLPYRRNSACSKPGIIRKTRFWAPYVSLVWNPTRL